MRQKPDMQRASTKIILLAALGALAACAAPAPGSPDSPLKSVMKFGGFATDRPQMAGFVVKSRPAPGTETYIPLGTPKAQPTDAVLTPDEVKAETARLNAARARQQGGKLGTKHKEDAAAH
ncbi:MAG: hypothetical protein KGQ37_00015 [Hyphomicrobiales bacterium]|nr:hypothetical protein [Hyphomicrobiales bacterium]